MGLTSNPLFQGVDPGMFSLPLDFPGSSVNRTHANTGLVEFEGTL